MQKPVLPFVESMLIYPCNLKCDGCSTFSDLTVQGYVTSEQGIEWLKPWTDRFDIQAWGAMGGEPVMNPDIYKWVVGVRQMLPHAQIRFVTNGLLLEKHWALVELLSKIGNCILKITVHVDDLKITNVIDKIKSTWNWSPVYEYGIHRWTMPNNFKFQINYPKQFTRTFQHNYQNMMPYDNVPAEAFDNCHQQTCAMLLKDQLYKCSNTALIPGILEKFNRPNWNQWQPYINQGLSLDATNTELHKFANNFGKPHSVCRQCPTKQNLDAVIDHSTTVTFK
jgi:hypothetical protein